MGKVIQFRVLYSVSAGAKRDFGTITLQDGHQLPDVAVATGHLRVRDEAGRKEESEEMISMIDRLRAYEAQAKAESKGVWNHEADKIRTSYELSSVQSFLEQHKGHPLDGKPWHPLHLYILAYALYRSRGKGAHW